MNVFIKKLCPLAAVTCFILCIIGALGVIDKSQENERVYLGLFLIGMSIFVLFSMLMLAGLYACGKEGVKTGSPDFKKGKKPNDKPFKKDKPAAKGQPKQAAKPAAKSAEKPAAKIAEKIETKPASPAPTQEKSNDDLRRDSGEQIPEESGPTTLYVCNISEDTSEIDLREEFEVFGLVKSVRLVTDKETGVSKGYAFVEMDNKAEAMLAIDDINGQEIKGQQVSVSVARKKPSFNRRWNNKKSQ